MSDLRSQRRSIDVLGRWVVLCDDESGMGFFSKGQNIV